MDILEISDRPEVQASRARVGDAYHAYRQAVYDEWMHRYGGKATQPDRSARPIDEQRELSEYRAYEQEAAAHAKLINRLRAENGFGPKFSEAPRPAAGDTPVETLVALLVEIAALPWHPAQYGGESVNVGWARDRFDELRADVARAWARLRSPVEVEQARRNDYAPGVGWRLERLARGIFDPGALLWVVSNLENYREVLPEEGAFGAGDAGDADDGAGSGRGARPSAVKRVNIDA